MATALNSHPPLIPPGQDSWTVTRLASGGSDVVLRRQSNRFGTETMSDKLVAATTVRARKPLTANR